MKALEPRRLGTGLALWLLLWLPGAGHGYGLAPGQPAPEFTLSGLNGSTHSLLELTANGPALLVFWSTHCHFCHAMIPELKQLHAAYHERGLTLAAINIGYEDEDEVRRYVNEHELEYLVLNEDARKAALAESYALVGTPTIVLISSTREVLYYGHTLPDLERHLPKADAP